MVQVSKRLHLVSACQTVSFTRTNARQKRQQLRKLIRLALIGRTRFNLVQTAHDSHLLRRL